MAVRSSDLIFEGKIYLDFPRASAFACDGRLVRIANGHERDPDAHLLYARALEAESDVPRALEQYAAVARYYAGAEAPLRYAQLLRASGSHDEARRVLKELLDNARVAPRYYRRMQRQWLVMAEHELSALS